MNPQEYLVTRDRRVPIEVFIDEEFGIEYETDCNDDFCSIMVFEIEPNEHQTLRNFITKEDGWYNK